MRLTGPAVCAHCSARAPADRRWGGGGGEASSARAPPEPRETNLVLPYALDCLAEGPNPLKGDLLVIGGSMLYAISNVTEEYFVKKSNRVEVMAMLGVFGAIISGIQISMLEQKELRSTHWTAGAILPFIGFALAMFLFYSTVPIILKICGATMLNLSLLTSDMWAVLIRIFAYHEKVDWMYFVAFAGTATGLVIYLYRGSKQISEETAQVTQAMDEEAATANSTAQVPGVGDGGPASNKDFSLAATASR